MFYYILLTAPSCSTTFPVCPSAWYTPLHGWRVGLNTLLSGSILTHDTCSTAPEKSKYAHFMLLHSCFLVLVHPVLL